MVIQLVQLRGNGAKMIGTFSVNSGDTLSMLIGQSPGYFSGLYPGGGGGTFVTYGSNYYYSTPLIVAGGGGGAGNYSLGINGSVSTNGTGLNPGINGNGAPSSACSGGGGGFYSSGSNDVINGFTGGNGFRQGGAGWNCNDSLFVIISIRWLWWWKYRRLYSQLS